MSKQAGFTIIELITVIVVITILLGLASVNLRNSLIQSRNTERKNDTQNIVSYLDSGYSTTYGDITNLRGQYPSINHINTTTGIEQVFLDLDKKNLQAPGVSAGTYSLTPASTNNQATSSIVPIPTDSTYVYQPIMTTGALCTTVVSECRKFNIFYKLENDVTIYKLTSKNQ